MTDILVSEVTIGQGSGRRLESHVAVAAQGPIATQTSDGMAAARAVASRTALILRLSRQGIGQNEIARRIGWSVPVVSKALKQGLAEAVANRIQEAELMRSLLDMRLDETVHQLSSIAAGQPQVTDYRQAIRRAESIASKALHTMSAELLVDQEATRAAIRNVPAMIMTPTISERIAANRAIAQITMQQAALHGLLKQVDPTNDEKAAQFMRLLRGEIDAAGNVIKPAKIIDVEQVGAKQAGDSVQVAEGTKEGG